MDESVKVIQSIFDVVKEKEVGAVFLSWHGFNIMGDNKSIDEVSRLIHLEGSYNMVRKMLQDERKAYQEKIQSLTDRVDQAKAESIRAAPAPIARAQGLVEMVAENARNFGECR